MRYGAAQHLKRREPGADEVPIRLPAWVAGRVEAAAGEMRGRHPRLGRARHRRPRPADARRSRLGRHDGTDPRLRGDRRDDVDGRVVRRRGRPSRAGGSGRRACGRRARRRVSGRQSARERRRPPARVPGRRHDRDARARGRVDPLESPPGSAPSPVRAHRRPRPRRRTWPGPARGRRRWVCSASTLGGSRRAHGIHPRQRTRAPARRRPPDPHRAAEDRHDRAPGCVPRRTRRRRGPGRPLRRAQPALGQRRPGRRRPAELLLGGQAARPLALEEAGERGPARRTTSAS